ncbi:caspase family protein [Poritiphilus flavus]|uniref:Peptidase C14 caspase domain-containing protein n=1 Tax=Poritiphilus flavus TaxID=2697053 RepID=A0A6L9EHT5_9FLAO|nr:caspase family protein [Poritiphilus flavus]NAS14291.1 hypothetical protein [Poritiphilus flavus]
MTRLSLIVGINYYRDANTLISCLQDIRDWKDLLMQKFDFPVSSIRMLTQVKETTKRSILDSYRDFLSALKAGDYGIFIFSGHGGQFIVDEGGKQELVEGLRTSDDVIYSTEIRQLLESHLNPHSRLVTVIDACHSGGATLQGSSVPSPWRSDHQNHVVLTSCRQSERAYGDAIGGTMRGVFTYYLSQSLQQSQKLTFREFLDYIKNHLPNKQKGYHQTPQFFGTPENLDQSIIV